jgi:hypothetical protein
MKTPEPARSVPSVSAVNASSAMVRASDTTEASALSRSVAILVRLGLAGGGDLPVAHAVILLNACRARLSPTGGRGGQPFGTYI